MFELLKEQGNEDGSEQRFRQRINDFKSEEKPLRIHFFWWIIHNCVAHPLIGVFPFHVFFRFHDYTARKINNPWES